MTTVPFVKYHGLGNDFVLLDGRRDFPYEAGKLAPHICHRRFGIGADGVIVLGNSTVADYLMTYVNSDGSAAVCGNGLRCLARFIYELGLLRDGQEKFSIETLKGIAQIEIGSRAETSVVDMGAPVFEGREIPLSESGEHLGFSLSVADEQIEINAVGMGNPHCVIFVESLSDINVAYLGPLIEHHALFPENTNVEFVQMLSRSRARMRVWERGVGETLACGTGASAVVAAALKRGDSDGNLSIESPGGVVSVEWRRDSGRIFLSGPATRVYSGEIDPALFLSR